MSEAIVVTSGKGGTGKSTVSAGLAAALALRGKKTIAIDADFGMRNLDIYLGLYERTIFDATDVIYGRCSVEEALTPHPDIAGLSLLAAPPIISGSYPSARAIKDLATEAKKLCDWCIIDCPAGTGEGFAAAVSGADRAILVTTPDLACITDSINAESLLRKMGIVNILIAVNRVRTKFINKGCGFDIDEIMDRIGEPLIGYVREDTEVIKSGQEISALISAGKRSCRLSRDIREIAARIDGENIPLLPRR